MITRLATALNRHGAVAAVELQHTGANSYVCSSRGHQIYGAVDGLNALGEFVPEMPEAIIEETIEAFANAADGKVDLIHVSAGSHEATEVFTVTHPGMFRPFFTV